MSTGVHNEKVGVDNEKALELDNRIFLSHSNVEISITQNATTNLVA